MRAITRYHLSFIFAALLFCSGRAQVSASIYLSSIDNEFKLIHQKTWEYTRAVSHENYSRKIEKKRREVMEATEMAVIRLKQLPAYNGDGGLRDSALSWLMVHYAVLNEDYARLVNIETISEKSYDAMEAYMMAKSGADERARQASGMINAEMKRFAADNGVQLSEGDTRLAANLAAAGKVYAHYNRVYQVFFRCYKQEAYLLDAMVKDDISGLEQNRRALADMSAEGLKELGLLQPYGNDPSLIKACEKMLHFYSQEAGDKLQAVSAYFVSKDNFNKMKTSFETGPAADRGAEAARIYRTALAEQQIATEEFQKTRKALNAKRSEVMKNWNNTCEKYIRKHVPSG